MSEGLGQLWPVNTYRLRLGEIEFDSRFRSIHREGKAHELSQRCFDLLQLFMFEPGVVHSREEIFRRVWPGVVVEDANITTSIWVLRKALGDEAKTWIRTVSKQGYIFDPPGDLEPVLPPEAVAAEPVPVAPAAPVEESTQATAPDAPVVRRRRLRKPLFIGVAATFLCLLLFGFLRAGTDKVTTGRIVLVAQPDAALPSEAHWPVELMYHWLDWQLRSASDRVVVGGSRAEGKDDLVILLNVEMPADGKGEWRVHASFRGASLEEDITRSTSMEGLVNAIYQVDREVFERLVPNTLNNQAAPINLDADSAAELVRGLSAEKRRRWNDAVASYRKILEGAPDFGFARIHLAQSLAELGQSNSAQAELKRAQPWVDSLPAVMRPVFVAAGLAIHQDYEAAADAYGKLWKNSAGEHQDFRLAEASNLRKAGRSRDALERLEGVEPVSLARAVPWRLELAEIQVANRDLGAARNSATSALEIARSLGWDHERAQALLLLMEIAMLRGSGQTVEDSVYDDAIAAFTSVGDHIGALRAQVYRELRGDPQAFSRDSHLDELLAETRAAGNVTVEVIALRRVGINYMRAGEARLAQQYLERSASTAEAAGDVYQQRLSDVALLRLDYFRNDYASGDRRIARFQADRLQGTLAHWIGSHMARVQFRRGQYEASLATLQHTEDLLRSTGARSLPQIAAGLSCLRGNVFISQGRLADAHTAFQACQSPEFPQYSMDAHIGAAKLDLLAGDPEAVRAELAALPGILEKHNVLPERWIQSIELAGLYTRVGELARARQLLDEVMPVIVKSGYVGMEMDARVGLAEIDLAEGQLDEAGQQAELAGKLLPVEDWFGNYRLRTVRIVLDYSRGRRDSADRALESLHDDARERGDVLGEMRAHSLASGALAQTICPRERQEKLLAQSHMTGASSTWMMSRVARAGGLPAPERRYVPM